MEDQAPVDDGVGMPGDEDAAARGRNVLEPRDVDASEIDVGEQAPERHHEPVGATAFALRRRSRGETPARARSHSCAAIRLPSAYVEK